MNVAICDANSTIVCTVLHLIQGIVAGFNLTKHEKLKRSIEDFRAEFPGLLVGVRHILDFEEDDYLVKKDVQIGLE
jgi:hypothetical protein